MRRREFHRVLGGAAAAWPLAARAQQAERMRRIGVLMGVCRGRSGRTGPRRGVPAGTAAIGLDRRPQPADRDPLGRGDAERIRKYAAELVALAPDVILASGSPTVGRCCRRPAPCRSCSCTSPIRSAPASSIVWRGRAATPPAFILFEYGIGAKWLELLKEIAPGVTRVAVLRDPAIAAGIGQFAAIQAVAPSFGVELSPVNMRDAGEIERAVAAFARSAEWRPDRDGERVGDAFIAI